MGAVITNKDGLLRKDNPLNQGLKRIDLGAVKRNL